MSGRGKVGIVVLHCVDTGVNHAWKIFPEEKKGGEGGCFLVLIKGGDIVG